MDDKKALVGLIVTYKTTIQIFVNSKVFFCILGPFEGGIRPGTPLGSTTAGGYPPTDQTACGRKKIIVLK